MKIEIRDKTTGRTVAAPEVNVRGMNYTPDERECFDEAWKCAVEDGAVDPAHRERYEFVKVEEQ